MLAEQSEHDLHLAAKTLIPLAVGGRMYLRFEFKRALDAGGIAIVRTDESRAGGINECQMDGPDG